MVDSRAKGARGEYLVRDLLREYTNLQFERVPMSGALEFMKGDLFVPNKENNYCIEVKNYKDNHFTDKVISTTSNQFIKWWEQSTSQAEKGDQKPVLFFKYNRSKIYVAQQDEPQKVDRWMYVKHLDCYVCLATDWLIFEQPRFING